MTAEQVRLDEARQQKARLEEVGAVPQRATVGHRARGLQRERRRLELLHPRPCPLARLPLGRRRHRRHLRRPAAPLLRLALWNGKDPILKERLFGLTNSEGNHGEDVKEYYFYLDSTPTHSYMKYLYKYPQARIPYADLVETNRRRSRQDMEYELLDTGVFDDDRYFDVFVEYAKSGPEDILVRITAVNRGPGRGRPASAADAVVPQRLVAVDCRVEPGSRETAASSRSRHRQARPRSRRRIRCWARSSCPAKATCRCSSPKTKPTTPGCSALRTRARTSRTASTTASCTAGRTR